MPNSIWIGDQADKLYLQSGQFSSTLKTSLSIGGIDNLPNGCSWDGDNVSWAGTEADKLYLQSGKFSSTLKTSLTILAVDNSARGTSFDNTNTIWAGAEADKLYLQSGQFSSTLKTSLAIGGVDDSPRGVSWDGFDTLWCGYQGAKLYLQSGQFSSTLKTSLEVDTPPSFDPNGIGCDGQNTLWAGATSDKLFHQSGKFSSTIKASLSVGGVDNAPGGIDADWTARLLCLFEGSVNATSSVSGSLTFATLTLRGNIDAISGEIGHLLRVPEISVYGVTSAISETSGSLTVIVRSDTPWAGNQNSKLFVQSGQFASTLKTSLSVSSIDNDIRGVAWDGTNSPWCGTEGDKLYLQSGQFSSTLKTSFYSGAIDLNTLDVSWDGTNTPWVGSAGIKLYLQSGQFSSTLKTSLSVSGVDTDPAGISFDGADTPWCGFVGDKLYLQSGQFSSTLKTSLSVGAVNPNAISWDGLNTLWANAVNAKLVLQSGQFSATIKTSLSISALDSNPYGIDTNDVSSRIAFGEEILLAGVVIAALSTVSSLEVETELQSYIIEISTTTGALEFKTKVISGIVASIASATGSLGLESELQSSVAETSVVSGVLAFGLVSTITIASGVISSLEIESKLVSLIATASGTTGSLELESEVISSVAEISNVSGIFKFELAGSITVVTSAAGSLELESELVSSATIISSVIGSLLFEEITVAGIISATASLASILELETELSSSVAEIASIIGSLSFEVTTMAGSMESISNIQGILELESDIISSIVEIANIADCNLDSQPDIISSIAEISNIVDCNLNSQQGCISSIVEASSTNSFLDVITQLVGGVINGISTASDVEIIKKIFGSATGISSEVASLDSQPECISSVAGLTSLTNYLSIVPDLDAATLFWRPQGNIIETLEWKTSILKAHDGTEQRIKIRQTPRQYFRLKLILNTYKENARFDALIYTWQKLAWLMPVWSECVEHTTDINVRSDVISGIDTTNADFRNNSKVMVWKSATEYEVVVVDTITDSTLNLSYSMLNTFIGTKYIVPIRTAYLIASSKNARYSSGVSEVDLTFAVYDNIEFTDYVPGVIYDGYEVIDTPAFMDRTHSENSDGDIFITDFETGIFKVESNSNFNFLAQNHIFFNDTKAACWNFRKFLHSLNGKQKTVLIPTFRDDVAQTDAIGTTDSFVKIENIKLTENMGQNALRNYIGFYFPLTSILIVRKIKAINKLNEDVERIRFNTNLGLATPVESGDCRICFVDKCRLTSDKIKIDWPYANRNECSTNFTRVYNGRFN